MVIPDIAFWNRITDLFLFIIWNWTGVKKQTKKKKQEESAEEGRGACVVTCCLDMS